jgi:hypothetical protein
MTLAFPIARNYYVLLSSARKGKSKMMCELGEGARDDQDTRKYF